MYNTLYYTNFHNCIVTLCFMLGNHPTTLYNCSLFEIEHSFLSYTYTLFTFLAQPLTYPCCPVQLQARSDFCAGEVFRHCFTMHHLIWNAQLRCLSAQTYIHSSVSFRYASLRMDFWWFLLRSLNALAVTSMYCFGLVSVRSYRVNVP